MRVAVMLFALCAAAAAGEAPAPRSDAAALPGALATPGTDAVAIIARHLPTGMSVARHSGLVVAATGPTEAAAEAAERIGDLDARLRRQAFPGLDPLPITVIVATDDEALAGIARALYPGLAGAEVPRGGFYDPRERLILAAPAASSGPLLRELTRARLRESNPEVPEWLEQALVTLYASAAVRGDRLVPTLDRRMELIPPDEDLGYDVFAGICDCTAVSAQQIALMRLLLVFLDGRGELHTLLATVAAQGRYTTLLQALDGMRLDRVAWKEFADRSVRAYRR